MKKPTSIKDIEDNFKKDFPFFDNFERKAITEFYSQQIIELLDNQKKDILDEIEKSKCDIPKKSKFKNVIDEFNNLLLLVGRTNYNKALEDIKNVIKNLK